MRKLKVCLFSFSRIYEGSMIASQRIARMLSGLMEVEITTDLNIAEQPEKLDALVVINGAYAFCKCLPRLGPLIERARRLVWVQQDYSIIPPRPENTEVKSPFRRAFVVREESGLPRTEFWTTCQDWQALTPGSRYINWNALTFDERRTEREVAVSRQTAGEDLFYYGAYRADSGRMTREPYFDRYFREPRVPVTISAPDGDQKKTPYKRFKERFPKARVQDKITADFHKTLASHGAGLYIEDRMSHDHYHSPANRFYEMLSAGLPMIFQPESGFTMRTAGYRGTEEWQAKSPLEVMRMMERRETILMDQRRLLLDRAREEKTQLLPQVRAAWSEVVRGLR